MPEKIRDDPFDYCQDEEEAAWRSDGQTYSVPEFFEALKQEFRLLRSMPVGPKRVVEAPRPNDGGGNKSEVVAKVRDIFLEHGWPDLERYNKAECLRAKYTALNESGDELWIGQWKENEQI
jgi:hypothetical protein